MRGGRNLAVLHFGKHRGRHIDEIDDAYLLWIVGEFPESDSWWKAVSEKQKQEKSAKINVGDLLSELKHCTRKKDLSKGRRLHTNAVKSGVDSNIYVGGAVISLYTKCGSMEDARRVFDSIQEPDVVCWNALILGYAENGQGYVALDLLSRMKRHSRRAPDSVTYLAALKACTLLAADGGESGKREGLEMGKQIHSEIGCHMNHFIQSTLINLYGKCGNMDHARTIFSSIKEPDVVCWNALILGHAENGQGSVALDLFARMKDEGRCAPNSVTYLAALKACTVLAADAGESGKRACFERGIKIHSEIGFHMNHSVKCALINLYGNCGSIEDARTVFDSIQEPNVVSWTAIILAYAENGEGSAALYLFSRMKEEGRCAPNSITYLAAIKALTFLAAEGCEAGKRECLERGRQIHSEIVYHRHMNLFVQSTLINLYGKCGSMEDATRLFDSIEEPNVVCWNALILGYTDNGQGLVALDFFSWMKNQDRCAPDCITYLAALKACSLLAAYEDEAGKRGCLEMGRQIHSEIGHHMDHFLQNALINLYGKCGSMRDARTVFDSIQEPNVLCWSALILAYTENGQGSIALDLFARMMDESRCTPNSVTYLAALKACCSIGALAFGRRIHSWIIEYNSPVVTSLVDFYAKCGCIEEAREVFGMYPQARTVSTWNALLAGYSDTGSVFSLFEAMKDQGFQPDAVTFVCVLSCCSHAGLIEKAWEYLEVMPTRYGVTPSLMHYTCMIDLLGRANKLDEAVSLLQKMPCDPNVVTWTSLLGACRKWKNAKIGRWAFKYLMDLDRKNASSYVLMADMYGNTDMWKEQVKVLEAWTKFGGCKQPGQAYVMGEDDS